jgi:hypothetical protein
MRTKHLAGFIFALAVAFFAPRPAAAITCSVSHVFSTGETLTAANLNANPSNEVTCINNIDWHNVGSAGFFASNLIPTTTGQATFGGSSLYTFPAGINAGGPVTATNVMANSIVPQPVATPNSSSTII